MKPFEIIDKFDRRIKLTEDRIWSHISKRPEMLDAEGLIKIALKDPDEVRESKEDANAWLYYKVNPKGDKWNKFIIMGTTGFEPATDRFLSA